MYVTPVALFSPEPQSSVLAAVGLAEVASLEASLPASEPMTMQRLPTFGEGIVSLNVDTKYLLLSETATIEEVRSGVDQVLPSKF